MIPLSAVDPNQGRAAKGPRPSRLWLISLTRAVWPYAKLDADEAANTLFRFFRSKHVLDLKRIMMLTITLLVVYLISLYVAGVFKSNGEDVIKVIFPAFGVTGVVIAWAYRSASARLGVVDLFACEISTLCRVGTIIDIGSQYVGNYKEPPQPANKQLSQTEPKQTDDFVSKEDYFPILETNARDLQLLEALVVAHITEFYTYMKAVRDFLRKLATLEPPPAQDSSSQRSKFDDLWHKTLQDVIYILFLGYESGRKAVEDLIEFQPTRAENRIVILLTELKCYSFLRSRFDQGDVRQRRLELRLAGYMKEVPDLCLMLEPYEKEDPDWCQAKETVPELSMRYEEAVGESMNDAVERRKAEKKAEEGRNERFIRVP